MRKPSVHVIGGFILDLVARKERYLLQTSNVAAISYGMGGVGYNIYRALPAERGASQEKYFYTVIGNDALNPLFEQVLAQDAGIFASRIPTKKNAIYIALMEAGELYCGACDLTLFDDVDPTHLLAPLQRQLHAGDLVVLEGNLTATLAQSIVRLAQSVGCAVILEPVSIEKAARHRALTDVALMTPTEEELASLLGYSPDSSSDIDDTMIYNFMTCQRIEHMVVTKGARGLTLYERPACLRSDYAPTRKLQVQQTNGAGDFLLAQLASAWVNGRNLKSAIRQAMVATEDFLLRINSESEC